jgi:hypothetical protein
MRQTGEEMNAKYKETSLVGLRTRVPRYSTPSRP